MEKIKNKKDSFYIRREVVLANIKIINSFNYMQVKLHTQFIVIFINFHLQHLQRYKNKLNKNMDLLTFKTSTLIKKFSLSFLFFFALNLSYWEGIKQLKQFENFLKKYSFSYIWLIYMHTHYLNAINLISFSSVFLHRKMMCQQE